MRRLKIYVTQIPDAWGFLCVRGSIPLKIAMVGDDRPHSPVEVAALGAAPLVSTPRAALPDISRLIEAFIR